MRINICRLIRRKARRPADQHVFLDVEVIALELQVGRERDPDAWRDPVKQDPVVPVVAPRVERVLHDDLRIRDVQSADGGCH